MGMVGGYVGMQGGRLTRVSSGIQSGCNQTRTTREVRNERGRIEG